MNTSTLTAIAAAVGLAFCAAAMASTMPEEEYKAAKKSIGADYKSAKAGCEPLQANAKDICLAQAKGNEKVALAELQATYRPTAKTRYEARIAKAEAGYDVAKEQCDDKTANDKGVCVKEAKAALTAAKADARTQMKSTDANKAAAATSAKARHKAHKQVAEARKDATLDKRDADYAVAKEKCEASKGSEKDTCLDDAKRLYGKS